MAKQSLSEQLDAAVEAMMADRDASPARLDARVTALLRIAGDLRDLPRADFKARLKAELQRRASASPVARATPGGSYSATPCLVVRDAPRAIEFYRRAFGATESMRVADSEGHVMHAEIEIGGAAIAIAPEMPEWGNRSPQSLGGSPVIIQLYVEDVDALASQAVAAGATVLIPVADQFYGDRAGRLADPFGHIWIVATHKEDMTPEEMQRRAAAWMQQQHAAAPSESAAGAARVEPYLSVQGATRLMEFLKQAFVAEEVSRHVRPDGSIAHAEMRIGDSVIGIGDSAEIPPRPTAIHLYVPDADALYRRAHAAGATSIHEPVDQDYGDREASVKDPFGNHWYIGTHKEGTYIPAGLHTATPYLHPHGAPRLIEFLKQAFGAAEAFRAQSPDGTVVHAKIRIGESTIEMGEAHGPYQPMPAVFHLYVNDTDAVYRQALAAGAASLSEPADQPWGYRNAGVLDPCHNQWWINAPIKQLAAEKRTQEPPSGRDATGNITKGVSTMGDKTTQSKANVIPALRYNDAAAAIEWLCKAFGFEKHLVVPGEHGSIAHAQLTFGNGMIMLGSARDDEFGRLVKPPRDLGGCGTQSPYIIVEDADKHYARAVAAGARIVIEIKDEDYGGRGYSCQDPEGHVWNFGTYDPWAGH